MSSKTLLLPLAAFIGSAAFLTWQHFAQVPIRQQATLFRGTVQAVTTHRAATQAKAVAASRSGDDGQAKTDPAASSTRPVIDLKEMATLMAGMQNGTMPDLKAMLKLQKTILELSSEELSTLITDAGQLELPPGQRNNLVMMLIQGLSESDPQAAVMAAAAFMKSASGPPLNMIGFTMRNAFASWAKKDLTGALTWFDGAVAAGQFESTALSDVNQEQTQMISSVLKTLWTKDPDAARERILALPEKERTVVLASANGFEADAASQKEFSELVRGVLPAKEQAGALQQLAQRVYSKDSLDGVSKFFSTIEATPEERATLVAGVAETSFQQRTWGNGAEKPNLENTTKLRSWLAQENAANAETTLGKSIASTSNGYGNYSPADALALVTELHSAQPSDDLLVSFLDQAKPESNKEALQALAARISDPAARDAALAKLAEPAKP